MFINDKKLPLFDPPQDQNENVAVLKNASKLCFDLEGGITRPGNFLLGFRFNVNNKKTSKQANNR